MIAPCYIQTPIMDDTLKRLEAVGIKPGQGITLSDIADVVPAATKCAVDETATGRCICVCPEGCIDFADDEEGNWAADFLKEQAKLRKENGDVV